jgi:hypothetical protein
MIAVRALSAIGLVALTVSSTAGAVGRQAAPQQKQQPTYRATTDVVSVNVAVLNGRTPVTGLHPYNFRVVDNGVRQTVEAAQPTSQPIDVTLVLTAATDVEQTIRTDTDADRLRAMLRPADRIRLIKAAETVTEVLPMQPVPASLPTTTFRPTLGAAITDAVFYALAWPTPIDRQHLIIVFTDGLDSGWSTLDSNRLATLADHSDAVLHVVVRNSNATGAPSFRDLDQAVRHTGGALHHIANDVAGFEEVMAEFRSSYVVQYHPRGVKTAGWHTLSIDVPSNDFTIRARHGYDGGWFR